MGNWGQFLRSCRGGTKFEVTPLNQIWFLLLECWCGTGCQPSIQNNKLKCNFCNLSWINNYYISIDPLTWFIFACWLLFWSILIIVTFYKFKLIIIFWMNWNCNFCMYYIWNKISILIVKLINIYCYWNSKLNSTVIEIPNWNYYLIFLMLFSWNYETWNHFNYYS